MARIAVTGASGFVGSAVIDELFRRGHHPVALRRSGSKPLRNDIDTVHGDLFDDGVDIVVRNADAVVHLVGIILEDRAKGVTFQRLHVDGTDQVIRAMQRAGVRRLIHMSALGTRSDAAAAYHQTKWLAEERVRSSGLDATIVRPSLIHGPRGDFMRMVAMWARGKALPFLFMPYFGRGLLGLGGAGLLQPVHVDDVARVFVDCVEQSDTGGQTIEIGGPDRLTWPQLHRVSARAIVGRPRMVAAIPVWWAKVLTAIVPEQLLGANRSQVLMSQEDNTCDIAPLVARFGWTPRGFEASLAAYARSIGR
jgi:NADH dehydrogenase